MTAKEMQKRYWEKELKDAERGMQLAPEESSWWEICQKRHDFAQERLWEIEGRGNEHPADE